MAFESNYVTMIGNLTDDPELRFLPSGTAVCNFRIASNRRYTDKNGQQQEETTFIDVNAWRDLGENVAESIHKGDRVVVIGRLRIRSYQAQDGTNRWVTEIEADEVSPSLRWARVEISKTSGRTGGGGGDDFGNVPPPPEPTDDVPF